MRMPLTFLWKAVSRYGATLTQTQNKSEIIVKITKQRANVRLLLSFYILITFEQEIEEKEKRRNIKLTEMNFM